MVYNIVPYAYGENTHMVQNIINSLCFNINAHQIVGVARGVTCVDCGSINAILSCVGFVYVVNHHHGCNRVDFRAVANWH